MAHGGALLATPVREAAVLPTDATRAGKGGHGGNMPYDVTLIPGDGTGPEITEATRRVLEATGVEFNWHLKDAGLAVVEKYGTVLPDDVIESIKETKIGLKGPITT